MKRTLAENVFTVAGLLAPAECRELIARGEKVGFQQAAVRTAAGPQMMTEMRNNDRAEFLDADLAADLWRRLQPFVPTELDGGTAVGLDTEFRFYRYDVGQRFKLHRDGVVERSPTLRTRLSCLFYLNDGFTGGETVFYNRPPAGGLTEVAAVVPAAGAALLFLHEWRHEGRELFAGRKYVLRSDVFYCFPETETAN